MVRERLRSGINCLDLFIVLVAVRFSFVMEDGYYVVICLVRLANVSLFNIHESSFLKFSLEGFLLEG
jgi:hypothetical protein